MNVRCFARQVSLAALLLVGVVTTSEAVPILDQSQLTIDPSIAPLSYGKFLGQEFTAGITGTLTQVDIYLLSASNAEGVLYDHFGNVLQTSLTPLTFTTPGFYSFFFNYAVAAGDTVNFAIHRLGFESVEIALGSPLSYTGGIAFSGDVQVAPWLPVPAQTAFRTYVDNGESAAVPEPASLTLVGLGLAGFARRWRARSKVA